MCLLQAILEGPKDPQILNVLRVVVGGIVTCVILEALIVIQFPELVAQLRVALVVVVDVFWQVVWQEAKCVGALMDFLLASEVGL